MDLVGAAALLALVGLSFALSASVGLGGSLVLIPALSVAVGVKEAIPLAALLLGTNNLLKMVAYRHTIPWRAVAGVVTLLSLGAAAGAIVLLKAPNWLVTAAVILAFGLTLVLERLGHPKANRALAPLLAWSAGATSGFSGTSGPLKGVALRALQLDRRHLAGGASLVSLAGDATKAGVFAQAGLLDGTSLRWALAAVPMMFIATTLGYRINRGVGEAKFAAMFWAVVGGYAARLFVT
jgi:uncharacterized protein